MMGNTPYIISIAILVELNKNYDHLHNMRSNIGKTNQITHEVNRCTSYIAVSSLNFSQLTRG